jgi:Flp pilus assembly protein TadD
VNKRQPRPRALPMLTALGAIVAAGGVAAIVVIVAITARSAAAAAAPPNYAKAVEAQKRLAAERPQDAAVFNDLGNLLILTRQPAEAEAAYRHAVEIDPRRTSALFNLGLLLQQKGTTSEARQVYEKVLEIEPRHAWAHYQLGTLYESKKDKSRAVREYAQAFAADPQLAFRDVNPQIVENGLVTESLLLAYRRRSAASEAPSIYEERSRIIDLLAPSEKQRARDAAEGKGNEPPAPAAAPPGAQRSTVLRSRDLPTGSNLGQATPPGIRPGAPGTAGRQAMPGGYAGGGASGYTQSPDAPYPGAPRQWTRPNPNLDATQPGQVVTPPPVGLYYRPGVPSTGRLGTQVIPEQEL